MKQEQNRELEVIHRSERTRVVRAQLASGECVVLKMPSAELPTLEQVRHLEHEFEILQRIGGDGVVNALALERIGARPTLVLEDAGLQRLHAGQLSFEEVIAIALRLSDILSRIHGAGIVHGDINPANIVHRDLQDMRLIDFGLACEPLDAASTEQRGLMGTPEYLAPEQTGRTQLGIDQRTDLYSLGVTLFQLSAGRLPFSAQDILGWVHAHMSQPAPQLCALAPVPLLFGRIVDKLLQKDPAQRYQSAAALRFDLSACLQHFRAGTTGDDVSLGSLDALSQVHWPTCLLERDPVLAALSDTSRRVVMLAGATGLGRSALLNATRRGLESASLTAGCRPSVAKQDVPLSGLAELLHDVADRLLFESSAALLTVREALNTAVYPNGAILLEVQPRLQAVLGPQPHLAEVDLGAADRRRQSTLQAFFEALCGQRHVVLFVDDAQWLDAQSLSILSRLLVATNERLRLLFAVECEGRNEVESTLAGVYPGQLETIDLAPLSPAATAQLLQAALPHADHVEQLATVFQDKCAGNPLLMREMFALAQREGALWFSPAEARWQWSEESVAGLPISGNAVAMMVERLQALPTSTQRVLEAAAIIGDEFSRAMLSALLQDDSAVDSALAEAQAQRLLSASAAGTLSFAHSGIRSALYESIPSSVLQDQHLRMLRWLEQLAQSGQSVNATQVVRHCRGARALLSSQEERLLAVRWERQAAAQARNGAGYQHASEYLNAALSWLTAEEWAERPQDRFAVLRDQAECIAMTGASTHALTLTNQLLELTHEPLERVSVYRLQAQLFQNEGRLKRAIDILLAGLKLLGIELPLSSEERGAAINDGVSRMQAELARATPVEIAQRPDMTDPRLRTAMELLLVMIPPSYQLDTQLFVLTELKMFELTVTHGLTPASCKNLIDCGLMQIQMSGNYDLAFAFADAAYILLERYAPTPLEAAVRFIDASFISPWRSEPVVVRNKLREAYEWGERLGDIAHAGYSLAWGATARRLLGEPLDACVGACQEAIAYCQDRGMALGQRFAEVELELLRGLRGDDPPIRDSAARRAACEPFGNSMMYAYWQTLLIRANLLDDEASGSAAVQAMVPLAENMAFDASKLDADVLIALWHATHADGVQGAASAEAVAKVCAIEDKLAVRAARNRALFGPMHQLVRAERHRVTGSAPDEVAGLYEKIVDDAASHLLYVKAFACERHADLWLKQGRTRFARLLMREARALYEQWGAHAKAQQLDLAFPELLGGPTNRAGTLRQGGAEDSRHGSAHSTTEQHLDIESVAKAMTAISSEVVPERLFSALMKAIVENAGAQHGYLVSCGDELWLEASARLDEAVTVAKSKVDATELPASVLRYVARTGEDVILHEAGKDTRFAKDPCILERGVRSVLCLPIRHAGAVWGLLYVENNAVAGAFLAQHVRLLRIIAGQAAISIENARMYDNLEQLVRERTSELATRNREITTLLDNLPQGVFAIAEDLTIRQRYSAQLPEMLGETELAGRNFAEVLFAGSQLPSEQIATHLATLEYSFGMPAFMAEVNWPHLIRSFRRVSATGERDLELDWACIVDEQGDVSRVLATVRDVTQLRALERQLSAASEENALIGEVLTAGLDEFTAFCHDAEQRIERCLSQLESGSELTAALLEEQFRHLHTLKGNARVLGLVSLSREVHAAEEPYAALRKDAATPLGRQDLLSGLQGLADSLTMQVDLVATKLGGAQGSQASRTDGALRRIQAEIQQAKRAAVDPDRVLQQISAIVDSAAANSVREVVRKAGRVFAVLADELGKPAPALTVIGADSGLEQALAQALQDALVHVFRNALDHGIETPEERLANGKDACGHVEVYVEGDGTQLRVRVQDDGRGLPLARLRERLGPSESDAALAEAIFQSGVSTAAQVTQLSGRGVGMDAVRSFIASRGGQVSLEFTREERNGYRPFAITIQLPRLAQAA